MKKILCLFLLSLTYFAAGCGASVSSRTIDLTSTVLQERDVKEAVIAKDTDSVIKDFAVRLFQQSLQEDRNTLISPVSVLYALGMTANGADGETLAQMEEVFGTDIDNLNSYVYVYDQELPEDEEYKLSMANSIWIKNEETLEVNKSFLEANRTWYDADVYQAPFDKKTLVNINSWVSQNTGGKIEKILDEIPEDARLYLINALTFDAEWNTIYEEYQVREGLFTGEDGKKSSKEFMYCEENQYLENEDTTGFIKYYKNKKYAFAALLPREGMTMEEYVQSLNGDKLEQLLEHTERIPVDTSIPKFEVEYDVEMRDILSRMGMPDAFSPAEADFSRMAAALNNIYIGRIIHKTSLQVSETGTEAGAATVVDMKEESALVEEEPQERKTVYLDRPFVYLLMDCEEELPIFIGSLTE